MITFSEESRFLLKNWDRVAELMDAADACGEELQAYLDSVEDILRAEPWWGTDLEFITLSGGQCYVSKKDWEVDDAHVIWIGVEDFSPDAIFSATSPPSCYLWLQSRAAGIADSLLDCVQRDAELKLLIGSGTYGQKARYLLRKKLRRWYPEELDEFASGAPLREIADFIGRVYLSIKDYKLTRKGRS